MFPCLTQSARSAALLCALLTLVSTPMARAQAPAKPKPAPPAQPAPPTRTLKVFLIGNSLSGNAAVYLPAFAKAGGKEINVRPIMPKVVPSIDPNKAADLRRIAHEIVTVRGAARVPDAPEAIERLDAPHSPATNAPDTTLSGQKPPSPVGTPPEKDE